MRFKIKEGCGDHSDEFGRDYTQGDIITTDHDLVALFGDKFEALDTLPPPKKVDDKPTKDVPEHVMKFGKDVTDEFEIASEAGFLVFKKGSWYNVFDDEDPSIPLNENGIRKGKVKAFIEDRCE